VRLSAIFRAGLWTVFLLIWALPQLTGCRSASEQRVKTDEAAAQIISEKQVEALGSKREFSIERPSDILRRRLLSGQKLPYSGSASLGTDKLQKIDHWPEEDYPAFVASADAEFPVEVDKPIRLSLIEALRIGAKNSFDYQTRKEQVFQEALSLELERDVFRNTFFAQATSLISTDSTGDRTVSGLVNSGEFGAGRKLKSGADITSALAIDLANLLTLGNASAFGIKGDATISIPLLRGSGEHIVTEPLNQAERNVVYELWNFERFRKEFAVGVASGYLSVLQQLDQVNNSEADYRSRVASARRSRRLADAGRIKEIEVDQAVQNELRARQRWIAARQRYEKELDSFKSFLGLPPDAQIRLDPNELECLTAPTKEIIRQIEQEDMQDTTEKVPPADAPIELEGPDRGNAGVYEMNEPNAIKLALDNRLDLKMAGGEVYDAQRAVVVAADALGAELTFFGSADWGGRRDISSADSDDAKPHINQAVYSGLLTLDLPLERTEESINYRNSFIELEQSVRNVQILEDRIKTEIINALRDMLEARENLYIQAKAVYVAQKRVKSVNMFLDAGRAQTRDLLEAQDALLSAQNALTSSVVDYRIAELSIQRDMGVLQIDDKGLWQEYLPGEL